ncbi:MAG: extracellular solute-binding protein [Candidatus Omnitrophica bacterium]|nr:extracellular solute-binding protein [Candidatus Omnitrophota bacterium]
MYRTGVNVRFELYAPTPAYASKIVAAAQTEKFPDIYGVMMEMKEFASLIKAGHVTDLTPYMEENNGAWKSTFYKSGLAMNTFREDNQYGVKPGIYGVPIDLNNVQFIYNLELLKKAGWDTSRLPSTWGEFIALGGMLKRAGIPGLVSGWGEPWMIHCLADNFAWNIMGREKVLATIKGEVPYTDPSWKQVFSLFAQMRDSGLLSGGIVTMINKEAEQTFANERAAIAFNGSWCVNIYASMNPELRYAVAPPPKVNPERPMEIWGGATNLVVNDRSPVKEEAVKFLKWLTQYKQQCYLAKETHNIPSNSSCASALEGPITQFVSGMDNAVHPRFFPVEEFPLVTEAFDKGIQSIIIGEATPGEVAEKVQQTKLEETKKAKRFKVLREKGTK